MNILQFEPLISSDTGTKIQEYFVNGGWITEHVKTREFEQMLCEFTGAKYCSIMPNGTLSLSMALLALGVKPGDEVIVPAYTMLATATSVSMIGAIPVFCDIERETLCMDAFDMYTKISKKTKAIIYVSINGRMSNTFNEIKDIAKNHNLYLIEDAAQSLGSTYEGKQIGLLGDIGSFSFSMPKIITTGQGGALITDNEDTYNKIKMMRDFGRTKPGQDKYLIKGWNFKFTDIQALVGIEQMADIKWRVNRKKEMQLIYESLLKHIPEVKLIETSNETIPWFYDILIENRKELKEYLAKEGIGTREFYPPLHLESAYIENNNEMNPNAEYIAERGLWLPSSLKLSNDDIDYICTKISQFYT